MTSTTGAIFKVPKEAFVGIEEAHSKGFAKAVAYPNPGDNTLNIRTAVTMWQPYKAYVEVYDMTGKLIHSQKITDNITSINTESWLSGGYVWKVVAVPSTGSGTAGSGTAGSGQISLGTSGLTVSTCSTAHTETGKWVKE